ncbi:Hypothetical predicted protein [Mytilus galloprovincialis]|uniref:Uncharacterized protein n=1 Tax=Mytilus galloprovincialis TaxID=29158 RepID=A0A8B6CGC3_MYTGA|nr:Hypothetical predicted protein [Mytilus galloprovincialis]
MSYEWIFSDKFVVGAAAITVAAYGLYKIWKWWRFEDEYFQRIKHSGSPSRKLLVLIIGLDGSGKTCFLQSLGESRHQIPYPQPTSGVNSIRRTIGDVEYSLYEIGAGGGLIKARLYWSEFLKEFKAKTVVYVVDAANHQRIDEAKTALSQFSEKNRTENLQLLIVANKQDVPGALTPAQVLQRVKEVKYKYKSVHAVGTVLRPGKKREGVYESYTYLQSCVPKQI